MGTTEYRGHHIVIEPDDEPESPRQWDNLGRMWCEHRRYTLGDADAGEELDEMWLNEYELDTWTERVKAIRKHYPGSAILPFYLYDHIGLRISTGEWRGRAHHAEWDSGLVGIIYATRADILAAYPTWKHITTKRREEVIARLEGEVAVYDQYLSGDVWCYAVHETCGECLGTGTFWDNEQDAEVECCECDGTGHDSDAIDTCCGYYGYESALEEAKRTVDASIEAAYKKRWYFGGEG